MVEELDASSTELLLWVATVAYTFAIVGGLVFVLTFVLTPVLGGGLLKYMRAQRE